MQRRTLLAGLAAAPVLALARGSAREPIVGLPCEGCEAVFDGLPASMASRVRLAATHEPGEPMLLHGQVRDGRGTPRAGVIVYAYQTDRTGIYPAPVHRVGKAATLHGRLRAWAHSDADGRFAFDTIRPGHYPGRAMPQHIHLHVIEPGCATYYIDDVMFLDDPVLIERRDSLALTGRGGVGVVLPVLRDGVWQVQRDIVLGLGISDGRGCVG